MIKLNNKEITKDELELFLSSENSSTIPLVIEGETFCHDEYPNIVKLVSPITRSNMELINSKFILNDRV